jgi:hypothetical protein
MSASISSRRSVSADDFPVARLPEGAPCDDEDLAAAKLADVFVAAAYVSNYTICISGWIERDEWNTHNSLHDFTGMFLTIQSPVLLEITFLEARMKI